MSVETATLIICALVFVGAYSVEKGLRQLIERRFYEQKQAFYELKEELNRIRETLEDLGYKIDDDDDEEKLS
mgnify:CR=1 FL=1